MTDQKANEIADECVERLHGILNLNLSPLTKVFVKSLFEYAYYNGNKDGFREAIDVAEEGKRHA